MNEHPISAVGYPRRTCQSESKTFLVAVLLVALLCSSFALGQESTAKTQATPSALAGVEPVLGEQDVVIRKTVSEVNLIFTATDKNGNYVNDLKRSEVTLVDNNKPVREIRSFQSESDLPLQLGLIIDASNSIRDRFRFEQQSAIKFFDMILRTDYDKAFVMGFDVAPEVTQDFTDDFQALAHGVDELRPGNGTALYDALYFACREKLLKATLEGPRRRAIVLLSDGKDNQSHVTLDEAIEMAQRAEAVVYTISTDLTRDNDEGDQVLAKIADATGARAFVPLQLREIADAFEAIQDELRSQYVVSYKPVGFKSDGSFHSVEIIAQNRKGLHIHSRKGYFAPAE